MKQYSKEFKESIIVRMLPPNNVSVPKLVRDTGIPKDTLYSWRSKARKGKTSVESNIHGELSSEEKFNIVLETASLNETERSGYERGNTPAYPWGMVMPVAGRQSADIERNCNKLLGG